MVSRLEHTGLRLPGAESSVSRAAVVTSRIIATVVALFLAVDTLTKVLRLPPAVQATTELGYPEAAVMGIGLVQLACLVLYLIPRSSVLGAILLTGYLGGAVASQVRAGNPFVTHTLFPAFMGLLLWAALYLRDGRLRALIPLARSLDANIPHKDANQ